MIDKIKKIITKNKSNLSNVFGLTIIVITLMTCIIASFNPLAKKGYVLDNKVLPLTDNWKDQSGLSTTLPIKISYKNRGLFSYETTLPALSMDSSMVLLVCGKYMNTQFYLNDTLLGAYECRPAGSSRTLGMQYTFLSLPDDYAGMTFRMEGELLLGNKAEYDILTPMLGDRGQILFNIIQSEFHTLLVIFIVMSFALFLLLFSLHARSTKEGSGYFYTSLFSLIFSLYSLFSSKTIYFFVQSSYLIYVGEFLFLALLPLPLLILLYYRTKHPFKSILTVNIMFVFIHFLGIIYLHFFTKHEFRTTLFLTHIVILISLCIIISSIVFGSTSRSDRKQILITFSPIFVGTIGNILLFYMPFVSGNALIFLFCVLIFIILQAFQLIQGYLHACQENIKTSIFQKMAYTDALTGLGNRTAFEEKIKLLSQMKNTSTTIWCVVADVNGLKQVNDNLGHDKGDRLICHTATVLKTALTGSTSLYRTGGDEFVAFIEDCSPEFIEIAMQNLTNAISLVKDNDLPPLSIAIGCDYLGSCASDSISELLKRTDALMYENKNEQKKKLVPHT